MTSMFRTPVFEATLQAWVHTGAGYPLSGISLGHINNQFQYAGDGNYQGLFIEQDLTEQVFELLPAVPIWVEQANSIEVEVGKRLAAEPEHAVLEAVPEGVSID
jgi:hypothetical protein